MPGLIQETAYKHITVKELAPTFVAEVQGVDFSKPVESEVFTEIKDALAKVCLLNILCLVSVVNTQ
jgi:alpha-ketoglutarate-dependent 2,4-dichlorophenoxyacetate dioxygenase